MTTPLTWDRWKDLLLPHGWTEIYGCVLQSPLSPGGTSVQLVHVNDMTNAAYLLTSYESIELEDPIETPYQMMSLLHGLKIPLRSSPIHPPNPHSGKPVEQQEQVSNQADTRK